MRKSLLILGCFLSMSIMSGCNESNNQEEKTHEHTFDLEHWEKDETSHWHKSTCGHDEIVIGLAHHNFGGGNVCDDCGYIKPVEEKYIISFDSRGGSFVDPLLVKEGETFAKPNDPTKEGFVFFGWYETSDCSGQPYVFGQEVTKQLKLYACWGAQVTFVNYNSTYASDILKVGDKISEPANPTHPYAHFDGWYESATFEGEKFNFDTPITFAITLYARYHFVATFIGSDGNVYKTENVMLGDTLNKPVNPNEEYYDFDDWYIDEDFNTKFDFDDKLTKDLILYSRFTPKTYSITYENTSNLTQDNPENYLYGVGVEEIIEPTSVDAGYKFYGWYFDAEFKDLATSIPTDAHEDVTLYAKIAEIHSITYQGWPWSLDNPNPVEATEFDIIGLDGSTLEAIDGISNVKFKIDSLEVSSVINPHTDIIVNVEFSTTISTVTFDPNGGKILSKTPHIMIYGDIKEAPARVDIDQSEGPFNLYESEIFKSLKSIYGGDGVFKGFYKDSSYSTPLLKYDINYFESGSKIYALYENKEQDSIDKNLPYSERGNSEDVGAYNRVQAIEFDLHVPRGYKTINVSMKVNGTGDHSAVLFDANVTAKPYKSWGGLGNFTINEIINVEGKSLLRFQYTYTGNEESFESYSISFELGTPDDCFVECVPSEDLVTGEFLLYKDVEVPYTAIEKEYFTFNGWVDEDGNYVDLTSEWQYKDSEITLKADWLYNGVSQFEPKAINLIGSYQSLFDEKGIDFLEANINEAKASLLNDVLQPYLEKIRTDKDLGFGQDLLDYAAFEQAAKDKMWELLGNELLGKLISLFNLYNHAYIGVDNLLIELQEALDVGCIELQSLKDDPAAQVKCYKDTIDTLDSIINLYIV